jgi:hypothetical protein
MYRVLKPGGVALHIFPPQSILLEPHVFVPLASIVRAPLWISVWVSIYKLFGAYPSESIDSVVNRHLAYLTDKTNYKSEASLTSISNSCGFQETFVEREMLSHFSYKFAIIGKLVRYFPFFSWFCRKFVSRAVFLRKPKI